MKFLVKKKMIHRYLFLLNYRIELLNFRDLACRNLLVTVENEELIVKIADMGMSRLVFDSEYYKSQNPDVRVPIKWSKTAARTS